MWLPAPIKSWVNSKTPHAIRRLQYLRAVGVVGLIILVSWGTASVLFDTQKPAEEPQKLELLSLETSSSKLDLPELYYYKLDADNKKLSEDIRSIKESLEKDPHEDPEGQTEIEALKARLETLETQWSQHPPASVNDTLPPPPPEEAESRNTQLIEKHTLTLNQHLSPKTQKTVTTMIPAGAFAKTILLSGLDASAAMNASSDPRPMLLRIIDHGTLPRKFQSDLKDCHCTAGAFGDLSSERVYARLEKLTCVARHTGQIIETQVYGYIAGSDGKAGIRGVVASKDGQFLSRSLMGGFFSGLSNVANPQNRRGMANPFSPAGTGVPPISLGENFASGMATGATSALDRLSQYYIDRAEQLQPVIQVDAGQVVDIVFTEGVAFGSQTNRSELEENRKLTHQDSSLPTPSPQEGN